MPELPEVETVRSDLASMVAGFTFQKVLILDHRNLKGITPAEFKQVIKGKRIDEVVRLGKSIFLKLSAGYGMLVHLRMTGQFYCPLRADDLQKHTQLLFFLDGNKLLAFKDIRKFALVYLAKEEIIFKIPYLQNLGLDPLAKNYTFAAFKQILVKQVRKNLKVFLLDQHQIAGIGNIYASEILFVSQLSPFKTVGDLTLKQQKELFNNIPKILKKAIMHRGTTFSDFRDISEKAGNFQNFLTVYGRKDESCVFCKGTIEKIVQNGRSTFYCKNCQY